MDVTAGAKSSVFEPILMIKFLFQRSSEEVLRMYTGDPPRSVLEKVFTQVKDFWPFSIPFASPCNTRSSSVLHICNHRESQSLLKLSLILFLSKYVFLSNRPVFGLAPTLPAHFGQHQWTATVKVIGEDSNPIVGANVSVQYSVPTEPNSSDQTYGEVKGMTDTNGMFKAFHTDSSSDLGVTVDKAGYYTTHIGHQFYFDEKNRHPSFTLLLKNNGRPIAMYAKQIDSIAFPVFNKPIGYDLTSGDWVAPYGKGVNADFLFTENHPAAKSGYTFTVSFPNRGDGIQGFTRDWNLGVSHLLSSREAPIDGYQPKYEQTQMPDPNRIYYFRVHTALDSQGNILSTHYGKIYGDFMQFRYYLNPTPNDRNIEFDPKQNLLQGLQSFEQVSAP